MQSYHQYDVSSRPALYTTKRVHSAYQLAIHDQFFSPGTPSSSTTKTGRDDIIEISLKVTLNIKYQPISIRSIYLCFYDSTNCSESYVIFFFFIFIIIIHFIVYPFFSLLFTYILLFYSINRNSVCSMKDNCLGILIYKGFVAAAILW